MKKLNVLLSVLAMSFVMVGCGGGSDTSDTQPPAAITVNLIGTWDYQTFTENTLCDGLLAQGVKIVDSMNGDTSKMGNTRTQGSAFAIDGNQNCYLDSIDEITSRTYGMPSTINENEYLQMLKDVVAGDNTIQSVKVESFNNNKIQKRYEYTSGAVVTEIMTR